jgi:3-keto-disaccharide hydrolase
MNRTLATAGALVLAAAAVLPVSQRALGQAAQGWTALFDGKSLDAHWNKIGDANWKVEDGDAVATKGIGYLVSKQPYGNFQLRAEFWADEETNSGIFIRCSDPQKIGGDTCYEVNIFDKRPEPAYGTGAIVNVAKVEPMPKAAGKWNTYEITAQGPHLVVVLNGVKTADVQDSKHANGVIALQESTGANKKEGVIKFRKIEIKPL